MQEDLKSLLELQHEMHEMHEWMLTANTEIPTWAISKMMRDIESNLSRYWLLLSRLTKAVSQKKVALRALRKELQKSGSQVQHFLNLGWIGVFEVSYQEEQTGDKWDMTGLMDLWEAFCPILFQLQHLLLKLEKILTAWEKDLYLNLLYFSISEFPNRLRPPCTTMPWTIWPALVVLWGVCWMFYDELSWNWGDQGIFPTANNTAGPFEDVDSIDPSTAFNSSLNDITYDISILTESFDVTNPEQQLQLCVPGPAVTCSTGISLSFLPTSSAAKNAETTSPLGTEPSELFPLRFPSYQAARTIQESEPERAEATESRAPIQLDTSLIHPPPRNGGQTIHVSPRNSKHGKTEKYFCPYPACSRSQPGSGFYRKDHFDQHLRGPHKQDSVPRLRTKSTAGSSTPPHNLTVTNEATTHENNLQSKKRTRGNDGEINQQTRVNNDSYFEELAEERRLRLLAEQENQRLSQKLENYEGRMQKYEERLDKMMALMESYNVVKRRGFQLEDGNDN